MDWINPSKLETETVFERILPWIYIVDLTIVPFAVFHGRLHKLRLNRPVEEILPEINCSTLFGRKKSIYRSGDEARLSSRCGSNLSRWNKTAMKKHNWYITLGPCAPRWSWVIQDPSAPWSSYSEAIFIKWT